MSSFSSEALEFLHALNGNNSKEWFDANRKTYEREIKGPTKVFSEEMNAALAELTGDALKAKIFRINRDVRFSKDKTPYNTHVHISWSPTEGAVKPGMMFGLGLDYLSLGCGVFEFDKQAIVRFRERVASGEGEKLQAILDGLAGSGARLSEPGLKRVPSGFDKDHPREALLRSKGVAAWIDFAGPVEATKDDIAERSVAAFKQLLPLYEWLKTV